MPSLQSSAKRAIGSSETAMSIVHALRVSRRVHAPIRFLSRQLLPRGSQTWRLRDGSGTVVLRDRTDILVASELLAFDVYAPPAPVAAHLSGARNPVVLDLGANIGLFARQVLERWPGSRVVAVEPDPDNLRIARATIGARRDAGRVTFEAAAAATDAGERAFASGRGRDSRLADDGGLRVRVLDAYALVAEHDPDLVKVDIEGGEWELLEDARLHDLRGDIVMEWHTRGGAEAPGEVATRLLERAGYTTEPDGALDRATGTLWAWR